MWPFQIDLGVTGWCLVLLILFLAYTCTYPRQKGLPPGPPRLPLVGSLPFLMGDIRNILINMAAKYGEVFTIYMGSTRVVVLCGYDVIKEALLRGDGVFDGRSDILWKEFSQNGGIASASGRLWKEQRRFTIHVLRNFGMGKRTVEGIITEEATHLVAAMKHNTDIPFDVRPLMQKSVTNVITNLAFGKRYHYSDPEYERYVMSMVTLLQLIGPDNPTTLLPVLRYIPGDPFKYHHALSLRRYLETVYRQWIDEHKQTMDNNEEPADFIGSYLQYMKSIAPESDSTFSEAQLLEIVSDLFAAGTGTSVSTLMWALLYLILYPDVQTKVRAEIDNIIGSSRPPSMDYQKSMPYTEAVISEVQRICDLVPLNVPHNTTQDTELRGYVIPKDTMIFPVLYSVHWDATLWPEPEKFKPERFIVDGKYAKKEAFVPFSLGKRSCLGQSLARMELFLFLTNVLQRYTISLPENHPQPTTDGILGLTYDCKQFHVNLKIR